MDNEILGVEEMEVAEPSEEVVSEETQEVAEPAGKNDADAAMAQYRRKAEEAEKKALELEAEKERIAAEKQQAIDALGLYFEGGDEEEVVIKALANAREVDPEVIRAEREKAAEESKVLQENETLKEKVTRLEVEKVMDQALAEVKTLDPTVEKLEDLGKDFEDFIRSGLTTEQAYFATKTKQEKTEVKHAKPIGDVNTSVAKKDFYTKDEVDAMSEEELDTNYEAIRISMSKW